jgi:hypothetical protein
LVCLGLVLLAGLTGPVSAAVSEQIIVDQFGWRAGAARKVAIFADPITGQNSAVAYTPGASFQIRRVSDNATVFTGSTTSWKSGQTQTQSGDKVWYGDFSTLTTPGDYYVFDPTNNVQSYPFRVDDNLYNSILRTSVRTFYYQRCGTALSATYGGNWNHPICHTGTNQDLASLQWLNGASTGVARDVHGGWHDAGDMNKYVPFTSGVLWDLMTAYEWNPVAFPDDTNIPESGNGVPDVLDEVKYELDWLLRMQTADGSVCNRVAVTQYVSSSPPNTETIPRYYTQPTSWATATAAAHFAHASRLFANYNTAYPGYATTLRTAAENAWTWLNAHPGMTPSSGNDGGGSGGGGGGLASAGADSDKVSDWNERLLAAAQLYRLTGTTSYRTYFDTNHRVDPDLAQGNHMPLDANWFDPSLVTNLNRAYVVYCQTPGATSSIVNEVKSDLAGTLNAYLGYYSNLDDAYRSFMWDGHYCWGSNQLKAGWGNLLVYGVNLNVNSGNTAAYRELAEEYLHYFHGRNPLSWVYLSNTGTKGANLGADKPVMELYHGWFGDGTALYDGAASTYGAVPGYLAGGANQFYGGGVTPPTGEPMMKAYRDWNTSWPENSWEVTEPAIYYQAAYTLLLSHFSTAATAQVAAPVFAPVAGSYSSAQSVTISSSTSGASIRYTTNGTMPTSSTGSLYAGSVAIGSTTTLKAIAYKSGMSDSTVTSGTYTISLPGSSATLRPVADAYARDGTYATTNYGLETALHQKNSPSAGYNRMSYLKFDTTGVSGTAGTVKLRLYGWLSSTAVTNVPVDVHVVSSTTWTETGITWNTKPVASTSLGRITVLDTTARWYELDVTGFVNQERSAGRKVVSLRLSCPTQVTPVPIFHSDEASSNQPQLSMTGIIPGTGFRATNDAHVRDGSYASSNYGQLSPLELKKSTTGYTRQGYVKFDTTGYVPTATGVKLRLWARLNSTAEPSVVLDVYSVASTTWTEGTLTWNNRPALGTKRGSVTVVGTTGAWYEVDVTAYVNAERAAGRKVVSLGLTCPTATTSLININSDEATSSRPMLLLTP